MISMDSHRQQEFREIKSLFKSIGLTLSPTTHQSFVTGWEWKITHSESGDTALLYYIADDWSIVPIKDGEDLPPHIPSDIYDLCDANGIYLT